MKINKIMDLGFLNAQTCDLIEEFESFKDHEELTERLKKTLYYGKLPSTPRPSLPLTEVTVELFSKAVPKVHLDVLDVHYAASISKNVSLSPCSLMLALLYLERLRHKNPEYLQTVSSCDLFIVSMMVASKYLCDGDEDGGVFNDEWAESARMDLKDLNHLEKEFLSAMEWNLFIKPSAFFDFLASMETRLARCEGNKRSWLTYTELCILVHRTRNMKTLIKDLSKVMLVTGIAYMSTVVTLLAAAMLAMKCCTLIPSAVNHQQLMLTVQCCPQPPLPTDWSFPLEDTNELSNQSSNSSVLCSLPTLPCFTNPSDREDGVLLRVGQEDEDNTRNEARVSVARTDFWLQAPSLWDTFKYWPTCCGPHSAFT